MLKMVVRWILIGLLLLFVGIQAVPYGRSHTNPPLQLEPIWDSPETRKLVVRACFDCHSNRTDWPWYSHIAPFSWLVQSDVDDGRKKLNFSEWVCPQEHAGQSAKMVREGTMPPWYYAAFHPHANLASVEIQGLTQGLVATFGEEEDEEHGKENDISQERKSLL